MKLQNEFINLNSEERLEIEQEVEELVPLVNDMPVILDIESIRINKPGKFEIDLVSLFKRKPVIYRAGEGRYFIDLNSTFQLLSRKK